MAKDISTTRRPRRPFGITFVACVMMVVPIVGLALAVIYQQNLGFAQDWFGISSGQFIGGLAGMVALGVTLGVGMLKQQRWARTLTLWLVAGCVLTGLLIAALHPLRPLWADREFTLTRIAFAYFNQGIQAGLAVTAVAACSLLPCFFCVALLDSPSADRYFQRKPVGTVRRLLRGELYFNGAITLSFICFLILPVMKSIAVPPAAEFDATEVTTAELPPPPPPPPEVEEEEPPEQEEPPKLEAEEPPPLDLSQLELALNPGTGGVIGGASFEIDIKAVAQAASEDSAIFSMADLDQRPRVTSQPGPTINAQIRRATRGGSVRVYIIFIVNQQGRVENPRIQGAANPLFDEAALRAVKRWKFEPGRRAGKPVRFRMRVPITFPKSR